MAALVILAIFYGIFQIVYPFIIVNCLMNIQKKINKMDDRLETIEYIKSQEHIHNKSGTE